MAVLRVAILEARYLAWSREPEALERIAELTDATHNIPELLGNWQWCDVALLRGMLGEYKRRWPAGIDLVQVFDRHLHEKL